MNSIVRILALLAVVLVSAAPLRALTVNDVIRLPIPSGFTNEGFDGLFDILAAELAGTGTSFDSPLSQHICRIVGRCASGERLAQANDLVIVGSQDSADGGVYVLDSITGSTVSALSNPDGDPDGFGNAVAIDGEVAVVGDGGEAFLFDARTGSLLNRLLPPLGAPDGFGYSVAIGSGQVLVGATDGASTGEAFVFDAATGDLLQRLSAPAVPNLISFGDDVAVLDNVIAVGGQTGSGGSTEPTAFLFNASNGSFLGTASAGNGGTFTPSSGLIGSTSASSTQPQLTRSSLPAVPLPASVWLIFVAFGGLFLVRKTV